MGRVKKEPEKRGRGRPPKDPSERLVRATGYVTPDERERFLEVAREVDLSEGRWVGDLVRRELKRLGR